MKKLINVMYGVAFISVMVYIFWYNLYSFSLLSVAAIFTAILILKETKHKAGRLAILGVLVCYIIFAIYQMRQMIEDERLSKEFYHPIEKH